MNDFPWYYQPAVNLEFLLTSICFVTPLQRTCLRNIKWMKFRVGNPRQIFPGALGYRIDQASKQCPSPASHLLISAGGFCPDPRRTRRNLGSSLPVFHLVGVPFGWQAFGLERTWHFFSEDEGKYFYLQISFLNNSGCLILKLHGIKHIFLNQIMANFSFFDHPHCRHISNLTSKTRQWRVVCDISRLRPLQWRFSETLAKKLVEVGCFSRFRGSGKLGVLQENILGVAYREAMNLELELFF